VASAMFAYMGIARKKLSSFGLFRVFSCPLTNHCLPAVADIFYCYCCMWHDRAPWLHLS